MVKQSASQWIHRSNAAPGHARAFVSGTLGGWARPEPQDDAQVVVHELVANAVRHTSTGDIGVAVDLVGDRLRVSVTDSAPSALPTQGDPHVDGGYGLNIVDALACEWGCDPNGDTKTVWAKLVLAPTAARSVDEST
jgi:anti-sigma regulatory factor (Ser/Thr protein kinase)